MYKHRNSRHYAYAIISLILTGVMIMGLIPIMNGRPERTVSIPQLSGGLNLRDSPTMIQDNQLTDSKNVWFDDGVLKTRPGIQYFTDNMCNSEYTTTAAQHNVSTKKENITKTVNNNTLQLITRHDSFYTRADSESPLCPSVSHIQFAYIGSDVEELPALTITNGYVATNYFTIKNKNFLYCFVSLTNGTTKSYRIYKHSQEDIGWDLLTDGDVYAPLVATHCLADGHLITTKNSLKSMGMVQFEGYNLISDYYRMTYSTVNKSLLNSNFTTHPMMYSLLESTRNSEFSRKTVTAKITNSNGVTYTHSVTLSNVEGWQCERAAGGDGLYMGVTGKMVYFYTSIAEPMQIATVSESDFVEDNMEITAPCSNSLDNYEKVFGMARSEWFGSSAEGISGGSRLFLGGNSTEKSLVVWSDLERPLYFDENCYAYVGNESDAVTGFGKQSDSLVIFKENELYMTKYQRNENITAENLINQNIIDYPANVVYFPMTTVNSAIGCDCPNTIELCRNRLVWACSNGKIYTLVTQNQYSERNIYDVSEMITRKLKNETNIKNAFSADWNGKYFLFIGSHAYVMDYNAYGYVYASSYSKTDDANVKIPWFYWELNDLNVQSVITIGDNLILLQFVEDQTIETLKAYKLDASKTKDKFTTDDILIPTFIKTKMFDFNASQYNKIIPIVNIAFGNNGGTPIEVSFVTEKSTDINSVTIELSESGENPYSNEYVHNKQIRPCTSFCNRFGIYINSEGNFAVDSISINYKLAGGTR